MTDTQPDYAELLKKTDYIVSQSERKPVFFIPMLRDLATALRTTLAGRDALRRELEGVRIRLRAADTLALAVDVAVRRGALNSRSEIADARLDYGEPFPDPFDAARTARTASEKRDGE